MADYVLSCCSVADLTKQQFEQRGIHYAPMNYEINGVAYKDDLGETIPFDKFYQMMIDGAETKTSQINAEDYQTYFSQFLKQDKDILHLCLSSGITGSINSANIAKEELLKQYPDRRIVIIDSLNATAGFGLLMDKLADLKDEGKTIDEVADFAIKHRLNMNHYAFSTDLTFYIKGGRISKAAGFVGQALNICPILTMTKEGRLAVIDKIRTKKKAMLTILETIKEHIENGLDYCEKCYISHTYCLEDAKALAELVEATFPKLKEKVNIYNVGTTIGAHCGPGTVTICFWGKERTE